MNLRFVIPAIIFSVSTLGWSQTSQKKMRPLSTDRPDKTESPISVDSGHFQFETDILNYSYNRKNSSSLNVNNINFKYGLTENSDIQIIAASYIEAKNSTSSNERIRRGFGDSYLRYKYNFVGNEGGMLASGILPFVKIPTAGAGIGNRHVETGVLLPVKFSLPNGWSLGTMIGLDHLRKGDDKGWQTDYVMSMTLSHEIFWGVNGFIELYSRHSDNKNQNAIATFDTGLTYEFMKNVMADAGAFFGITDAAPDFNPFLGLSAKF